MDLSNLTGYANTKKNRKRVGRGESSGYGKTSGRGHKGQNSRSGGGTRPGFEGGQLPLYKRLPKLKGFTPLKNKDYEIINLSTIEKMTEEIIDIDLLKKYRIVSKNIYKFKVLGNGELTRKVTVKANMYTETATKAIEKAGGTAETVNG